MSWSDSETAEDRPIFKNDSLDSGISDDLKESPKNERHNLDNNLQQPINQLQKKYKKSSKAKKHKCKLKDDISGGSGNLSSQECSDKVSRLMHLWEEEKRLKILIAKENLKKEQPVILDTDILREKISEYQILLEEARNEHKMKNVMCLNLQMANTLQKIVSNQHSFSDGQRKSIEDLLKKKKELNKITGVKRKEIADIDENILELEKTEKASKNKKFKLDLDVGKRNINSEMDSLEELERLKDDNEKVTKRVCLLSEIIQSLVPLTGDKWQEDPDLLDIMEECEKVSSSQFENLDCIYALLTGVCSVML